MAWEMGADAIKFQSYTPDTITMKSDRTDFMIQGGLWAGYTLHQLYEQAHTPFEWHEAMFEHARKIGITCFSTPFDETAVDLLEDLNTPAYKIASFEAIDIPLIRYVASTGKPMIISTGMANLDEVTEAVQAAMEGGCNELALMHCISGYPVPVEQSNLLTIPDLEKRFGVVTGLSDHTTGTTVSVAAVALGACVIEKHVTLSRDRKGPDSVFSLEPEELKQLCAETRNAWLALGRADYSCKPVEEENIIFRRSIYVVRDIQAGETLTKDNIRRIRPGYGLPPKFYNELLGRRAKVNLEQGTALRLEHVE